MVRRINNLILRMYFLFLVYRSLLAKILVVVLVADILALVLIAFVSPDSFVRALEVLERELEALEDK